MSYLWKFNFQTATRPARRNRTSVDLFKGLCVVENACEFWILRMLFLNFTKQLESILGLVIFHVALGRHGITFVGDPLIEHDTSADTFQRLYIGALFRAIRDMHEMSHRKDVAEVVVRIHGQHSRILDVTHIKFSPLIALKDLFPRKADGVR